MGVDDNIRGYGCDGWTNCVDGITWNWPKLSVGGKLLLTKGQRDLQGGGTFYQGDSDGCRFLSLSLDTGRSTPLLCLLPVLLFFFLRFFLKLIAA